MMSRSQEIVTQVGWLLHMHINDRHVHELFDDLGRVFPHGGTADRSHFLELAGSWLRQPERERVRMAIAIVTKFDLTELTAELVELRERVTKEEWMNGSSYLQVIDLQLTRGGRSRER
jgi:hypothetical protein